MHPLLKFRYQTQRRHRTVYANIKIEKKMNYWFLFVNNISHSSNMHSFRGNFFLSTYTRKIGEKIKKLGAKKQVICFFYLSSEAPFTIHFHIFD